MSYEQFALVYDRLMEEMPYTQWIRFAQQAWEQYGTPQTVADLGCGTGNIAIPLAQTGLRVTGFDLSEDMLAIASEKQDRMLRTLGSAPGASIQWVQQDMREWEAVEPFDSVVSFCDSINYLTEEDDVRKTFLHVYKGLKPGGTFLFDMHSFYTLEQYAESQPFVLNDDDIAYIWTCEYDELRQQIEHELSIFVNESALGAGRGGFDRYKRIQEVHIQRAYDYRKAEQWLKEAGFTIVHWFGDFNWKHPEPTTQRIFCVACK